MVGYGWQGLFVYCCKLRDVWIDTVRNVTNKTERYFVCFCEPSIVNICINETVFCEESGCPYGDVPSPLFFYLRFSTFQFHDFPFVYSYLIKPFDSERNYPVLFFRFNREVPGSLVFFLTVRGLELYDVIPLSTHETLLFEFWISRPLSLYPAWLRKTPQPVSWESAECHVSVTSWFECPP